MKKLLLNTVFAISATCLAFAAQAQTGVGTISPDASAQLEINSTTKGLLPPRMTQAQRNAITSPAAGLVIFNTTSNHLEINTGTPASPVWVSADAGSLSSVSLTSTTSPAGTTTGQMAYNTNASSGLPVGPVYWDGTQWVSAAPGSTTNITLTSSTAPAGSSVGQTAYNTGSVQPTGLVYWDGTQWKSVNASNAITLTSATSPAGASVGQTAYNTGSVQPTGLVYWDGTQWKSVSASNSVSLTSATSPAGASVGQTAYNTSSVAPTGLVYWDGTKWVSAGTPNTLSLTSTTSPAGTTTGQMAYNTNASSGLPVGPVYWDGSKWVSVASSATAWALTGNAGTTAANFLGTTDSVSLRFRTSNAQRMIIDSVGAVSIGAAPEGRPFAMSFAGDPANPFVVNGMKNVVKIENTAPGAALSLLMRAKNASSQNKEVGIGIYMGSTPLGYFGDGSGNTALEFDLQNQDVYVADWGGNLMVGDHRAPNAKLEVVNDHSPNVNPVRNLDSIMMLTSSDGTQRMVVTDNGRVGIGASVPSANAALDVNSSTKGFLPPRVALSSTASASPLSAFTAGMVVYNTATANDVTPGLYVCDGTKWNQLNGSASGSNSSLNIGDEVEAYFAVPGSFMDLTGLSTVNTMANFNGSTGSFSAKSLYSVLSAADKSRMIVIDGLRLDLLSYSSNGLLAPRFFNTTGSAITYSRYALASSTSENANLVINPSYYSDWIDNDDFIAANNVYGETETVNVGFNNGHHYRCTIYAYRTGAATTSATTVNIWMSVKRLN